MGNFKWDRDKSLKEECGCMRLSGKMGGYKIKFEYDAKLLNWTLYTSGILTLECSQTNSDGL